MHHDESVSTARFNKKLDDVVRADRHREHKTLLKQTNSELGGSRKSETAQTSPPLERPCSERGSNAGLPNWGQRIGLRRLSLSTWRGRGTALAREREILVLAKGPAELIPRTRHELQALANSP